MQSGYTKYCCFLCLRDSRAYGQHYSKQLWPSRSEYIPWQRNVKYEPLVTSDKIYLPPLHIKLGLIKQFVKANKDNHEAFHHLKEIFPGMTDAKLKEGILFALKSDILWKTMCFK